MRIQAAMLFASVAVFCTPALASLTVQQVTVLGTDKGPLTNPPQLDSGEHIEQPLGVIGNWSYSYDLPSLTPGGLNSINDTTIGGFEGKVTADSTTSGPFAAGTSIELVMDFEFRINADPGVFPPESVPVQVFALGLTTYGSPPPPNSNSAFSKAELDLNGQTISVNGNTAFIQSDDFNQAPQSFRLEGDEIELVPFHQYDLTLTLIAAASTGQGSFSASIDPSLSIDPNFASDFHFELSPPPPTALPERVPLWSVLFLVGVGVACVCKRRSRLNA